MDREKPLQYQGPVIDRAHLDRMTGGDASLASEVLELFAEQVSMWERVLDPTAKTEDWLVGAHTIKGSARGIGAWDLAEICGAAEEDAKARDLTRDERRVWTEAILKRLDEVVVSLATVRHELAVKSLKSS